MSTLERWEHGDKRKITLVLRVPAFWDAEFTEKRGKWIFDRPLHIEGLWPAEAEKCFEEEATVDEAPTLKARVAELESALTPFANFADQRRLIRAEMPITQGSAMARRQLTMGDCYKAWDTLAKPKEQPEKGDE